MVESLLAASAAIVAAINTLLRSRFQTVNDGVGGGLG
jgi:hypothetical protein